MKKDENMPQVGRAWKQSPIIVPKISINRWQVCNFVLKAKLYHKRDVGRFRKQMPNVFSLAFEQCFFSVVFSFCKFYLVSCNSLASSVSSGHRSEGCWPIAPLTAAWLLRFAQGRLLVPQQDRPLPALIASQPLWHQLRSLWMTAAKKQQ